MENETKGGGAEIKAFDYEQVDADTALFLQKCSEEIDETLSEAATRVGGILKKAQDKLAQHGYGCFGKWLEHKGYARSTAYELIDRYNTFVRISDNQRKVFESLPTSLSKAVSAKSAESTPAKALVDAIHVMERYYYGKSKSASVRDEMKWRGAL